MTDLSLSVCAMFSTLKASVKGSVASLPAPLAIMPSNIAKTLVFVSREFDEPASMRAC